MASYPTPAPPSPSIRPAESTQQMPPPVMNQLGSIGAAMPKVGVEAMSQALDLVEKSVVDLFEIAKATDRTLLPFISVIANAGSEIKKKITAQMQQAGEGAAVPPQAQGAPPSDSGV